MEQQLNYPLNYKFQNLDSRDLIKEHNEVTINATAVISSFYLDSSGLIYNQRNLGSCTANASCSMYSYLYGHGYLPSRLYQYYKERSSIQEDGATVRQSVKSLAKNGVCSEASWPYLISKANDKPPSSCDLEASVHKITKYESVLQNLVDVKACLLSGKPFIVGFVVYSSFMNINNTGIMPMPLPSDKVLGGHCVMVVGFDDSTSRIKIQNSWGNKWGDKGYFYMPYDYFFDSKLCNDFWTI